MVQLFGSGRSTTLLSIDLGPGLHSRYHLSGVSLIMKKVKNQPRTAWEELVNDLKEAGTKSPKKKKKTLVILRLMV